jgi:hypothetical protein
MLHNVLWIRDILVFVGVFAGCLGFTAHHLSKEKQIQH